MPQDMPQLEIKSVADLLGIVNLIDSPLWWRGQTSASWKLAPSIYRKKRHPLYESNILFRFREYAPSRSINLPRYKDLSEWLSLARHSGLPTRLLDWSQSPLIALWFATAVYEMDGKKLKQDAALYCLDPLILNKEQGIVNSHGDTIEIVGDHCDEFCERAFLQPKEKINHAHKGTIASIILPQNHIRMMTQYSHFTIHDTPVSLVKLKNATNFMEKFIIPKTEIRKINVELYKLGIRESLIYPDLEGVARELARTSNIIDKS